MKENVTTINVNDLTKGQHVWVLGGWMTFDHICPGPRGDSRWICTQRKDGSVNHHTTHRWSRESVKVSS